jgi:Rrf2 family protein
MAENKGSIVSAAELSRELAISWSLLRRILQELGKEGFVRSYRGKGGGFSLQVPAHEISLLELIKKFQGHIQFNNCRISNRTCSNVKSCELKKKVSAIENHVVSELRPVTIASLVDGNHGIT